MTNKYLEKIAKTSDQDRKDKARFASGGVAGAGALTVNHQYHRGNLTGRETLFHGTANSIAEKIKTEGIVPRKSKGIIDTIEGYSGEKGSLKSDDLSFTHTKKKNVAGYASNSESMHGRRGGSGKILDINAPTWNKEFNLVDNPERHIYRAKLNKLPISELRKKLMSADYERDFDQHRVHRGVFPSKYIKDSPHYVKNSVKEIKEFAKAKPGRFLKGWGKAGLGAAAIAAAPLIYNKIIHKKEANIYLEKIAKILIKPSHKGKLHDDLGIPEGKKIPSSVLKSEESKAKSSGDTKKLKQVVFAENARKWKK